MEQHLSQYKIFYAVAKAGNISKAAKELFISQPAISKSISKLEENLGVSLFTRNSRGVQLTVEGQVLFSHVSNAFDTLGRGENELKRIKNFNIGQIKIGVIAEPKTRRSLSFMPVMRIEDTFVCTKSYLDNLKIREGEDVNIFSAGTVLLLDRNNMTRTHIDAYFAEHNIEIKQVLEATTMDLLIEFAKTGLGVGCVIREFVRGELADGSLIEIPLSSPVRSRTVGFAYNPAYATKTMNNFIRFCSSK